MKTFLRFLIMVWASVALVANGRGASEESDAWTKFKDFLRSTPTPTPSKKKKKVTKKKATPSPSPKAAASPKPKAKATAKPKATPEESATPAPVAKPKPTATPEPSATPIPEVSATVPPTPSETPRPRPTPVATPRPTPTIAITPSVTPVPSETVKPTPTPVAKKGSSAPNATVAAADVSGYESYSPEVRKLLDLALDLTNKNLGYKYGSADPANGGMDCSGFIHYVLSKNGVTDAPRDAREQYVWVRKAGNFQAVLGHSDDSFELDALKPGDLLFWAGTYNVDRDPAITHTMIYVGREKGTNRRIMVGSSDGRTYKGQSRFGVSVFDFKVARLGSKTDDKPGPVFVGYGRIPSLPKN